MVQWTYVLYHNKFAESKEKYRRALAILSKLFHLPRVDSFREIPLLLPNRKQYDAGLAADGTIRSYSELCNSRPPLPLFPGNKRLNVRDCA